MFGPEHAAFMKVFVSIRRLRRSIFRSWSWFKKHYERV